MTVRWLSSAAAPSRSTSPTPGFRAVMSGLLYRDVCQAVVGSPSMARPASVVVLDRRRPRGRRRELGRSAGRSAAPAAPDPAVSLPRTVSKMRCPASVWPTRTPATPSATATMITRSAGTEPVPLGVDERRVHLRLGSGRRSRSGRGPVGLDGGDLRVGRVGAGGEEGAPEGIGVAVAPGRVRGPSTVITTVSTERGMSACTCRGRSGSPCSRWSAVAASVSPTERRSSAQRLVEDDTEGVHVRAPVDRLALHLLGGDVLGGPDHQALRS